jgi:hypothetical protein
MHHSRARVESREKIMGPGRAEEVSSAVAEAAGAGPYKEVPRLDRVPNHVTPSLAIGGSVHSRSITSRTGNTAIRFFRRRRWVCRSTVLLQDSRVCRSVVLAARRSRRRFSSWVLAAMEVSGEMREVADSGPKLSSPFRPCAEPCDSFARDRGISPQPVNHESHREHHAWVFHAGAATSIRIAARCCSRRSLIAIAVPSAGRTRPSRAPASESNADVAVSAPARNASRRAESPNPAFRWGESPGRSGEPGNSARRAGSGPMDRVFLSGSGASMGLGPAGPPGRATRRRGCAARRRPGQSA